MKITPSFEQLVAEYQKFTDYGPHLTDDSMPDRLCCYLPDAALSAAELIAIAIDGAAVAFVVVKIAT